MGDCYGCLDFIEVYELPMRDQKSIMEITSDILKGDVSLGEGYFC